MLSEDEFSSICDLVRHLWNNEKNFIVLSSTSTFTKKEIEVVSENEDNTTNILKYPQNKPLAVIGKSAMYVRESYMNIYDLIIDRASKGSNHKFLVTGTSGIGKSCFLIYFIIRLLHESKNVMIIFQPIQSTVFYCFEGINLSSGSYDDFSTYLQSPKLGT